ncbi:MAG: PIG-L family deacetylase [Terriglobia bacterium]|jgi:N-acetylglucosamine malate deacetylase 1
MTRRTLFKGAASGVFGHAMLTCGQPSSAEARKPVDTLPGAEKNRKLKVVLVGAHVDDWIFCVGTLARYAREGHEVLCFSFTPGDSQGMAVARHMSVDQLASIRREDAMKGTRLFGAQFKILDQHNQKMHVDPEAYIQFNQTLAAENPDVVFGLWPLQFHPDHRAAGNLAFNAWLQCGNKFEFYFCETYLASEQTAQQFAPNRWVDVESVLDVSRQAIMGNTLEDTKAIWADYETCVRFRGAEYGCQYAEAFVHIVTVGSVKVPPNPVPGLWYSGLDPAHDE